MPSFYMNTRPETCVPLTHCVINDALSQAIPDLRKMLLQFIDVMDLISVANVSVHASMQKEDILAFNLTQEYTNKYLVNFVNNKAKR